MIYSFFDIYLFPANIFPPNGRKVFYDFADLGICGKPMA
jgi:hypothetical protein